MYLILRNLSIQPKQLFCFGLKKCGLLNVFWFQQTHVLVSSKFKQKSLSICLNAVPVLRFLDGQNFQDERDEKPF